MRIAQVVTLVSPDGAYGGPVRVAVNQLAALKASGHDVTLFSTHRGYEAPPAEIDGVRLVSYKARTVIPKVGFAGLASCGSVWVCPVCNAKVQAVRRLEVGVALATVLVGGGAAFGAYTVQHHSGSGLDVTWRGLSKCWQAVARDKSVRRLRASMGYLGTIRAAEVTYGANGWHPHLHPVHLFSRPVSAAEVATVHGAQFRAW